MKRILILFICFPIFSQTGTFTDRDGNTYPTVVIGNHEWTTVNSKLKTYNDGTPIPYVENETEWNNLETGAWCYVMNDPGTEEELGILYNFYAIAQLTSPESINGGYINNCLKPNLNNPDWIIPGSSNYNFIYEKMHFDSLWKFLFQNPDYPEGITKSIATNEEGWWVYSSSKNEGPSYQPELNNSTGFNAKPIPTRNENGSFRYGTEEPNNPLPEVRFWAGTNYNSSKGYNFVFVHDTNNSISHDGKGYRHGYPLRFSRESQTASIQKNEPNIFIFPNPTNNILNIDFNDYKSSELFSIDGKSVLKSTLKQIDLSKEVKGIYFLVIEDINGVKSNGIKVIKKK
jgi:uncharacterized protein (TIGR02145 family)